VRLASSFSYTPYCGNQFPWTANTVYTGLKAASEIFGPPMKSVILLRIATSLALVAICLPNCKARDGLTELLARLVSDPSDRSILYSLEREPPDPRTMPALRSAFERGKTTEEKQSIAATLLRLGENSSEYFDYLAGLAKEAIEDRTPFFIKYDNAGNSIQGQFDPGFQNWCAENHKDPRAVAGVQAGVYLNDVRILAYAQDSRAVELLRQGLESTNVWVVAYSVEGLGRLHDVAALPLIAKALDRVKTGDWTAVAEPLSWFRTPEAERLLDRFIPDPLMRDVTRRQIQMMQLSETNSVLQRMGKRVQ
jgi:hypothetical protein